MRPSDISTVADFIEDEVCQREGCGVQTYIRAGKNAQNAFSRIIAELTRLQSCVPSPASESQRSGFRETGESDGRNS